MDLFAKIFSSGPRGKVAKDKNYEVIKEMNFDKLAGIYVYCADYHDGQGSRLYRLMSKIDIKLSDRAFQAIRHGTIKDPEWREAHEVYKWLQKAQVR